MNNVQQNDNQRAAVIDIGSNSVRLVIYDTSKTLPLPCFNEKVLCGLVKDLTSTGHLYQPGVAIAAQTLARFITLSKLIKVNKLIIFTTYAIRNAIDGHEFIKKIEMAYKVKIIILSGEEEAQYSAIGVLQSIQNVNGILGDLGGGSLELAAIDQYQIKERYSLPIGSLSLNCFQNRDIIKNTINDYLIKITLLQKYYKSNFYAVGGGFRSLAKAHMIQKDYPLNIIHNYEVEPKDLLETITKIGQTSKSDLKTIYNISTKRIDTTLNAALVLHSIIELNCPKKIIFSGYGLREGILYRTLNIELKNSSPLIEGCFDLISSGSVEQLKHYALELHDWMIPLLKKDLHPDLRFAACILNNISINKHNSYKSQFAFYTIVDSPIIGIDHKSKLIIALMLLHRYQTDIDNKIKKLINQFLNVTEIKYAYSVGLALRLADTITAGSMGIITNTKLVIYDNFLQLELYKETSLLIGDQISKRLADLAQSLSLEKKIITYE